MASLSPLLDLPAELRNYIYRYAIVSAAAVEILYDNDIESCNIDETALLRTNRQIRAEALPIFYAENAFAPSGAYMGEDSNIDDVLRWIAFQPASSRFSRITRLQDCADNEVPWRDVPDMRLDRTGALSKVKDIELGLRFMLNLIRGYRGRKGSEPTLTMKQCRRMLLYPMRDAGKRVWLTLDEMESLFSSMQ